MAIMKTEVSIADVLLYDMYLRECHKELDSSGACEKQVDTYVRRATDGDIYYDFYEKRRVIKVKVTYIKDKLADVRFYFDYNFEDPCQSVLVTCYSLTKLWKVTQV